jgi:hypothetical protein
MFDVRFLLVGWLKQKVNPPFFTTILATWWQIPTQYSYLLVNANGYDKIPWFWAWGRTPFMWFNVFYLGKPLDLEPTTLQTKDKKKNVTKWNHFFLGASQRLEACAILCKSLESIGSGHPFHDSLFFRTFSMDQNWDKPKSSKSLCHRMGLVILQTNLDLKF